MTLEYIRINNFQNHEAIEIELDPHCTVLVGSNGAGKSAILRGLLWASLNRWAGKADTFIRWGADDARVELVFENDNVVVRQKGKSGNLYFLNGEQLEGDLSRSIPSAIKSLVNMTEDNFHEQLDPAFWFSLTAGQVAKSLNKIVNLGSIDDTLAEVASQLRSARDEHKVVLARLEDAKNLKISLDWTKAADEELAALEAKEERIEEIRSSLSSLARKLAEVTVLTRIRNEARAVILCGQTVIEKMEKVQSLRKQVASISVHLSRSDAVKTQLAEIRRSLAVKRPRLDEARSGKCPLCGK